MLAVDPLPVIETLHGLVPLSTFDHEQATECSDKAPTHPECPFARQ